MALLWLFIMLYFGIYILGIIIGIILEGGIWGLLIIATLIGIICFT